MADPHANSNRGVPELTDELTGLPNRLHADVFLDAGWGAAQRGSGLAVVRIEPDTTGTGAEVSPDLLKAVAHALTGCTPRMDLCARYDHAGFVAVLLDCPLEQAVSFAEDVRWRVEELLVDGSCATVSVGVTAVARHTKSPEAMLHRAERLLAVAKAEGGNRVVSAAEPGAAPSPALIAASPEKLPRRYRILVVDDEGDTLRATRRLLERLGCEVLAASSSREALTAVTAGEPIDLLVTDIVMPDMSGFALVDLSTKVRADLPVLYISGHPQEEVYWGGTPGARSAFLGKPMEIGQLRAAVVGLLGERAPAGIDDRLIEEPLERRRDLVLIVDDDLGVLASLRRLIRHAGYPDPIALSDPTMALDAIRRHPVDLLILDLHMPGMDGFAVLEDLAPFLRSEAYLPVLVLTADDHMDVRRRALEAGAMDFLLKPFDPHEARARMRNLLTTRSLYRRLSDRRDQLETHILARTAELADTRAEILHRLARAAEYRDDATGRHAERVGLMSSLIGAELGMSVKDMDLLRRTAPLHDIGKIGVPDAILQKPEGLTPAEFEMMKAHTTIGQQILGGSHNRILEVASAIAVAHHERWDGDGYPHGLAGDEIPLEARIVTVADVFDSLTHERPYKRAYPIPLALDEISLHSGSQFDPAVVEAFLTISVRVGLEGVLELADPLDPLRDTRELSWT